MIIIKHRVNTIVDLNSVPQNLGVECDIRYDGDKLILHHDPFVGGEDFAEFLKHYHHSFLIANIKSEGIERRVIELLERNGIRDYFLLDVSFPFIMRLSNSGFAKNAVRFSEYESIGTALASKGKCEWVVVDVFTKLPLTKSICGSLSKNFKICLVSPELLGRQQDIKKYQKRLSAIGANIDAVLTKTPVEWHKWRLE